MANCESRATFRGTICGCTLSKRVTCGLIAFVPEPMSGWLADTIAYSSLEDGEHDLAVRLS